MTDEPTCGKGLAEHAVLPAKIGGLAAAMGEVLETHLRSLDRHDPQARPEHEAYTTLVHEYRDLASTLARIAARMAGYRDLPMAPHDQAVLMGPDAVESFAAFVRSERELLELLQSSVEQDETMLAEMRL